MIEEIINEYYKRLHPDRFNLEVGKVPSTSELVTKIKKIEGIISTYLIKSGDFYDGYINAVCDSLVIIDNWNPWLVHSFIQVYLTVEYTSKYSAGKCTWYKSLSKALSQYYDKDSVEFITSNLGLSPR